MLTNFRRLMILLVIFIFGLSLSAQEATPEAEPDDATILTPAERPLPTATLTEGGVTLEILFDQLPQGRAGLLHIEGEGITGARLRFLDTITEFFPVEGDGYYGFIVANMDQNPREYDFSVIVPMTDGSRVTLAGRVEVVLGGFVRQDDLTVPPDRTYLLDPQVERNEFAQLFSVFDGFTEEKMWDEGFQVPVSSALTSPFGAFRTFNQTLPARHTGWDLRAPTGTPVVAMGGGRVAFAGLLDIRGNHVIIDHGYGVYSGYSHLSQVHVTRGQSLNAGQIIGVSGNTGRSGGAHLHWEVSVNGQWVDSVDFLQMWLP